MNGEAAPLKAFLYTPVDTGGQSARLAKALRTHTEVDARSMAVKSHLNRYPEDLRFNVTVAQQRFEEADVVHLHNTLEVPKRVWPQPHDKPIILHHHGTRFRELHERIYQEANQAGAIQVASTIDLAILYPDIYWLPSPFELDVLAALRRGNTEYRKLQGDNRRIRVAHAPTNRKVKSTALVIDVVTRLHEQGLPIELDLIERTSWLDCLTRKAKADILIDQLHLGYGNNAIEAWAMGIPVIAGVEDQKVLEAMQATFPTPFLAATEATLEDVLRGLVADRAARDDWGSRGLAYVRRFHSDKYVAERLAGLYRMAIRKAEAA